MFPLDSTGGRGSLERERQAPEVSVTRKAWAPTRPNGASSDSVARERTGGGRTRVGRPRLRPRGAGGRRRRGRSEARLGRGQGRPTSSARPFRRRTSYPARRIARAGGPGSSSSGPRAASSPPSRYRGAPRRRPASGPGTRPATRGLARLPCPSACSPAGAPCTPVVRRGGQRRRRRR